MRQWIAASQIAVSVHANRMVAIVVVEREAEQTGSLPTNTTGGLTLKDSPGYETVLRAADGGEGFHETCPKGFRVQRP